MCLVDDEHRSAAVLGAERRPRRGSGGRARRDALGRKTELPGDGLVEVHDVARGHRDVTDAIEAGVQARGPYAGRWSAGPAVAVTRPMHAHVDQEPAGARRARRGGGLEEVVGGESFRKGRRVKAKCLRYIRRRPPSAMSPSRSMSVRKGEALGESAPASLGMTRFFVVPLRLTKAVARTSTRRATLDLAALGGRPRPSACQACGRIEAERDALADEGGVRPRKAVPSSVTVRSFCTERFARRGSGAEVGRRRAHALAAARPLVGGTLVGEAAMRCVWYSPSTHAASARFMVSSEVSFSGPRSGRSCMRTVAKPALHLPFPCGNRAWRG